MTTTTTAHEHKRFAWAALALSMVAGPVFAAAPSPHCLGVCRSLPVEDLLYNRVRFEAASFSDWHYHPAGQLIFIESGTGVVQERGKPARILPRGATYFTAAKVEHWHGAMPRQAAVMIMVHLGGIGPWLDPVTDAQYVAATGAAAGTLLPPRVDHHAGTTAALGSLDLEVSRVGFDPGAMTHWSRLAQDTVLLAQQGPLLLQPRGAASRTLRSGDSIFVPAGTPYRYGAPSGSKAVGLAIHFAPSPEG